MKYNLYIAWLIASVATLFSLYHSVVLNLIPCNLCYLQRIALFPLPICLFIIIFFQKNHWATYILPFPILGLVFSLTYFFQKILNCSSCYFSKTLPFGSFITFILILVFLIPRIRKEYRISP